MEHPLHKGPEFGLYTPHQKPGAGVHSESQSWGSRDGQELGAGCQGVPEQ